MGISGRRSWIFKFHRRENFTNACSTGYIDIHNSSNKRSDGSSRFLPISDTVVMKLPISFEHSGGIEQSNEELSIRSTAAVLSFSG